MSIDNLRHAQYGADGVQVDDPQNTRRLSDTEIQALVSGAGKRASVTSRPVPGTVNATGVPNTTATFLMVTACPVPYYAVRLHLQHWGKDGTSGALAGFKCVLGASDDIGSLDFTDITTAAFKKCVTPRADGVEYNVITTDGSPGWVPVSWGGAATASIAAPAAGKTLTASSDVTYIASRRDATNNCYPLLLRYINGSGGFSYASNLVGHQVGRNWADDIPGMPLVNLSRSTADAVTTPANWTSGNTPSATGSGVLALIEYFTAEGVLSVSVTMDSRGNVSSEFGGTRQYLAGEMYAYKSLVAAGAPTLMLRNSISGAGVLDDHASAVTENYFEASLPSQYAPAPANVAVYLIYSVNDGVLTQPLVNSILGRAAAFAGAARDRGQKVVFIGAFPKNTYAAEELPLLAQVTAFASAVGDAHFDALAIYGTPTGTWARFNYDSNHMTDAGYQDFGNRLAQLVLSVNPIAL